MFDENPFWLISFSRFINIVFVTWENEAATIRWIEFLICYDINNITDNAIKVFQSLFKMEYLIKNLLSINCCSDLIDQSLE